MSYKLMSYTVLLGLICIAVFGFISSSRMTNPMSDQPIGPGYFPTALSVILFILCILSLITTWKKEDQKISLPNIKYIILTILGIGLYILSWNISEAFFICTFVFLLFLLTLFSKQKFDGRTIWINFIVSLGILLFIYFLFDRLLNISL
ncbi:tripartite tricarboxylate transporter TctB family protein [Salibacterium aidingense]|uniref:tripartite tricarboxylate transporter TctB family protein n=1 Tax=Salibacterium aidingense TaxID=384933 RepID=UPI003BD6A99A